MEIKELVRLERIDPTAILAEEVKAGVTELAVLRKELADMAKIYRSDREVVLPGLMEYAHIIERVVADFKLKKLRSFSPLYLAKDDDITVQPLRPERFNLNRWIRPSLSVGTNHILPTDVGVYSVHDDEVIIVTDLIDHDTGARLTAVQLAVDGVTYRPLEYRAQVRASDLRIMKLPIAFVANKSLDIDAKVEIAGDTELTPYGVHVCIGSRLSPLT